MYFSSSSSSSSSSFFLFFSFLFLLCFNIYFLTRLLLVDWFLCRQCPPLMTGRHQRVADGRTAVKRGAVPTLCDSTMHVLLVTVPLCLPFPPLLASSAVNDCACVTTFVKVTCK